MDYFPHVFIMITIYMMLSFGLNLVVGFGGLLCLSHAVFYGIGAYTTSILMVKFGISFLPALFMAVIISGMVAVVVGYPALRFRGDSFVLVTLGFQVIAFTIFYNYTSLTNGPYGISGIPKPDIFGYQLTTIYHHCIFNVICLCFILWLLFKLYKSPFGMALKALRENEMAAESLGKSAHKLFMWAFVVAAATAAIPGGLFATYISYIDPTSFTLDESIFLLTVLLVGGTGNKIGPFLGTVLMILIPEVLRFVGLPDAIAANLRQIIYSLMLLILMFFRPQGIKGEYMVK